ncbi:ABC transporter permease [Terrisporobacter sp.]
MEISEVMEIVVRTLHVTVTATVISISIGIILSIYIYLNDFKLKKYLITMMNSLISTPPVIMGLIVFLILSRKGMLGSFRLLFTTKAMIIAQVCLLVPMATSLILDCLNTCGEDIINTCKILQINKKDTIIIFIKEIKDHIITSIITTFGRGISEVGAVMLVGGNIRGKTRVMTTYIAQSTSMGNFKNSLIIAGILLSISFFTTFMIRKLQRES